MTETMAPEMAEMAAPGQPGEGWTVYMLCYAEPLGDTSRPRMSAQHYVGSYKSPARIDHHRNGTCGAAICMAWHARGITFEVVRKAQGGKDLERRIKQNGHHAEYCPRCSPRPRNGFWAPL